MIEVKQVKIVTCGWCGIKENNPEVILGIRYSEEIPSRTKGEDYTSRFGKEGSSFEHLCSCCYREFIDFRQKRLKEHKDYGKDGFYPSVCLYSDSVTRA